MGNFAENLNLGNRFRPPPPQIMKNLRAPSIWNHWVCLWRRTVHFPRSFWDFDIRRKGFFSFLVAHEKFYNWNMCGLEDFVENVTTGNYGY